MDNSIKFDSSYPLDSVFHSMRDQAPPSLPVPFKLDKNVWIFTD